MKLISHKIAFTLAEVLITLGIIGVVAALTLPALIESHDKKVTSTRVKVAYSTIMQAIQRSEADNGDFKEWNLVQSQNSLENTKLVFDEYLKPYFSGLNYCSTGFSDSRCGVPVSGAGYNYAFNNGVGLSIVIENTGIMYIVIDTNGGKGPNRMGSDVFYFNSATGSLKPSGWYDGITRESALNGYQISGYYYGCKKDKYENHDDYTYRHACTSLLMIDGWEFKSDYPWK